MFHSSVLPAVHLFNFPTPPPHPYKEKSPLSMSHFNLILIDSCVPVISRFFTTIFISLKDPYVF